MCHEPMMHLNGTAPNPRSEYPVTMSCNLHVVGERCSSNWLINGDLCPLCEADKSKALAGKETIDMKEIERATIKKEEEEKVAAAETVNSKEDEVATAFPSLEASNGEQSATKGTFPHVQNAIQC